MSNGENSNGWTTAKGKYNKRKGSLPIAGSRSNVNRLSGTNGITNRPRKEKTDKEKVSVSSWMKSALLGDLNPLFDMTLKECGMTAGGKIGSLWESIHLEMQLLLKKKYTFSDGYALRSSIYENSDIKKNEDDRSLIFLTENYDLNLQIISLNEDFQPIKYGNPYFKTIQLLHIGYKHFMPLLQVDSDTKYQLSDADHEILANFSSTLKKSNTQVDEKRENEKALIKSLNELLQGHEHAQELVDIPRNNNNMKRPYYDVYDVDRLNRIKNLKICTLHIKNAHFATATIIARNGEDYKEISLLNRKNCGYNAFEGDTVYVEINDVQNVTGKVVGVQSSFHKPINSIYICKVCRDQGSLMTPLDGSFPKIHVDNEPGRRQHEKDLKSNQSEPFRKEQKSFAMRQKEQSRYGDNKYVSIYEVTFDKNTKRADFPKCRIEPLDTETCDKLFLVFYEHWDISMLYPSGKVVGMISTYDTFEDSLHLILPLCNIEDTIINPTYKKEINKIKKKVRHAKALPDDIVPRKAVVFTIDNEETQDMDDALSYYVEEDVIVVGVHISDITKYISSSHEIYKQAKRRFATAYTPKELGVDPIYVIEKNLSTQLFSLVPNEIRAVLSVVFHFAKTKPYECQKITFSETFIKSNYKLNYKQVERWIKAEERPSDVEEDLFNAIKDCYKIAKEIRQKRLPDCHFVRQSNNNKPNFRFDDSFNAQILIEEFMILANENVAKKIYGKYPNMSLIRVQDPVTDYEDWENRLFEFSNMKFTSSLKNYCNLLNITRIGENHKELIVSLQFYNEFVQNLQSNLTRARNMLQYDEYINDFYVHMTEWYAISPPARYECSIANSVDNRHFSLNKDIYTHFTSPIRRFSDVIVHKLLKSILNPAVSDDILEETNITEVCNIANRRYKSNKLFEKRCAPYAIFETNPSIYNFVLDCACSNITNEEIHFVHPSLHKTSCKNTIKFSHLSLNQSPVSLQPNQTATTCVLKWKRIIYSVNPISNVRPRSAFIIDSNLHAARLPESALRLFKDIRRSCRSPEELEDKIIEISAKFEINNSNVLISSDHLADPIIEIQFQLSIKNIIRIQFCSYKYNGLKRVNPELLIVNPSLQLCLIHHEDPVMCFVPGGKLNFINTDVVWRFSNISEYQNYFIPLIQLESLKEIMSEKSEHTFLDVHIRWIKGVSTHTKNEEIFGIINYDERMCEERHVEFSEENEDIETDFSDILEEGLTSITGDLVCLRGKLKHGYNYWVGHGAIVNVRKFQEDNDSQVKKILVFMLTQSDFDIFHDKYYDMTFSVETYTRSVPQKRQLDVVNSIGKEKFLKKIIFGHEIESFQSGEQHFQKLLQELKRLNVPTPNAQQQLAIKRSLKEKFSLIWGPPGTGKTSIGCILAYCYCLKKKGNGAVMYCGPSNESVNIIIDAMIDKFKDDCPTMLRVFSKQQELADFPIPGYFTKKKPLPEVLQQKSLHFLIRKMTNTTGDKIRSFDAQFKSILDKAQVVRTDSHDGRSVHQMIFEYKVLVKKAKEEFISNNPHDLILCTTTVSGTRLMRDFSVSHIIIDEAGMCKEPETLIPIRSASRSVENVVLIGDHKQLRPIILDDLAGKRGLQISLFERYQFLRPSIVTMLKEQYRMHPSICEFPSDYFYSGQLKTVPSHKWSGLKSSNFEDSSYYNSWNGVDYAFAKPEYENCLKLSSYSAIPDNMWPGTRNTPYQCFDGVFQSYPERILFINVVGDEITQSIATSTVGENSRANTVEIHAVGCIYERLIARMDPRLKAAEHITVLTQYRLQETLLFDKCKEKLLLNHISEDPIVKTVIGSQGSESDYVIFSTVRSLRNKADIIENPTPGWEIKYLGFITDHNQVNVALTRARKGLIIIGNKALLSANEMWKKLLINLAERGCVIDNPTDFI